MVSQFVKDEIVKRFNKGATPHQLVLDYNLDIEVVSQIVMEATRKRLSDEEKRELLREQDRLQEQKIKLQRERIIRAREKAQRAETDAIKANLCKICCWKPCIGAPCCYMMKFGSTPGFKPYRLVSKENKEEDNNGVQG